MLNWVNFLHLYQPPGQSEAVLQAITKESYVLIVDLCKKYPKLKLTLNIAGSLLEQLEQQGEQDFFEEIKKLVTDGRIELVGSAMYHPILPLLPEGEIRRQILLHNKISRKIFGEIYNPSGFFLPEMAYSATVAKIVAEEGFTWIILDEAHVDSHPDPATKYLIQDNGLAVIFRNRILSKTFPPQSIVEQLDSIKEKFIVTAHDGELYGHWHTDDKGYYEKAFTHPDIQFLTTSEYLSSLSARGTMIIPKDTNWEVSPADQEQEIAFALWNHPDNKLHALLWQLAYFCIKSVHKNISDPYYEEARDHLDRGLASCSWWWASGLQPEGFSILAWDPSVVERGAKELVQSVRSLRKMGPKEKVTAETLYADIVLTAWSLHWKKESESDILHP